MSDTNLLLTITVVVFFVLYLSAVLFLGGGFAKPHALGKEHTCQRDNKGLDAQVGHQEALDHAKGQTNPQTNLGRSFYAVGGSSQSANMLGINVRRTKFLAHVLCGLLAGLGGILYFLHVGSGDVANGAGDEKFSSRSLLTAWRYSSAKARCFESPGTNRA